MNASAGARVATPQVKRSPRPIAETTLSASRREPPENAIKVKQANISRLPAM